MSLLSRLFYHLGSHRELDQAADQIAAACQEHVLERVQLQLTGLPPAQARGYVRARAMTVVNNELQRRQLVAAQQHQLREMSLQRVVEVTLRASSAPAAQPVLRRAA